MQPSRILNLPTGMTITFRVGRPLPQLPSDPPVPEQPAPPQGEKEDS